jgi:Short C-terminal domain
MHERLRLVLPSWQEYVALAFDELLVAGPSALQVARRLVAVLALALLRRPGQPDQQPQPNPEEVLAQRLARGELDPEEYRQRLQTLQETTNRA